MPESLFGRYMKERIGGCIAFALLIPVIIVASMVLAGFIYDLLIPYVYAPPCGSSNVVVFDVDNELNDSVVSKLVSRGVSVIKGLSVEDFASLASCRAHLIVIVAHGLELVRAFLLPRGSYAIETSQRPTVLTVFRYPLYVLMEAIVRGRAFNSSSVRIAITENMIYFVHSLKGKVIALLTCPTAGTKSFAKALVSKGAYMVVYPREPLRAKEVPALLNSLVELFNERSLSVFAKACQLMGFEVVHGTM